MFKAILHSYWLGLKYCFSSGNIFAKICVAIVLLIVFLSAPPVCVIIIAIAAFFSPEAKQVMAKAEEERIAVREFKASRSKGKVMESPNIDADQQ